jgi:hypothetical protein
MKNLLLFACLFLFFTGFSQKTDLKNPKSARFTDKYVKEKRGTFAIETPELQELLHVIMAITPTGLRDSNLIDHTSFYYQKVLKRFQKFDNEPIVSTLNDLLKQGQYTRLRMNSSAFGFENDRLVSNNIYLKLSNESDNSLKTHLAQLEDFAAKSNFYAFFEENRAFYRMNRDLIHKLAPITKHWNWLESHFESRFDAYKIYCSPLANGIHASHVFEDNNFRETAIFVGAPFRNPAWSEAVTEGLNSRFIFIEITQYFCQNLTKKHAERIETVFSDPTRWSFKNFVASQNDAQHLFKKQLTWAIFTLYCYDVFQNEEDFKALVERSERLIVKFRGYKNFGAFNAKLLELYQNSVDKNIENLIPPLLDWAETQDFASKY